MLSVNFSTQWNFQRGETLNKIHAYLGMLLLAGLISCVYAGPTYINNLPYTINQSGNYILNTSCTNLTTTAITINADNVVLDGNEMF